MSELYRKMEACFREPQNFETFASDPDWRVRVAAAVAAGERGDASAAPVLERMLRFEDGRRLYDQPPATFIGSEDGTRMAEQIGPIYAVLPEVDEETREAWKCRGRVKFACGKATVKIGTATPGTKALLRRYLTNDNEAYNVKAASAHAMSVVGTAEDIPALETALHFDEWCTQKEAEKALAAVRARTEER